MTLFPIVTVANLEQFLNALIPIVVTLSGISIVSKFEQSWNALVPIVVTSYVVPPFGTVDGIATLPVGVTLSILPTDTLVVPAIIVYLKLESVKVLIIIIYKNKKK